MAEKPAEFENYSTPPAPPMTGANPDCRQGAAAAATVNHKSASHSLSEPEDHNHTELTSGQRRKASVLEKPAPTRSQDVNSHETFTGSPSDGFTHRLANFEPNSAFYPIYSAKGDPEQGKGHGAVHHRSSSSHQPALSPPASSHRPSVHHSMEGQRSPSPQFSPQRLSDKPPVSLYKEESNR